ncbi:hypothetical protein SUNI508_09755 [Seiridium unicorne]|uniref:Secreted protein n=1 Tax=Seiridium unicorne TaxID=138068 RepID=A0ABR2UP48_9PEZI
MKSIVFIIITIALARAAVIRRSDAIDVDITDCCPTCVNSKTEKVPGRRDDSRDQRKVFERWYTRTGSGSDTSTRFPDSHSALPPRDGPISTIETRESTDINFCASSTK